MDGPNARVSQSHPSPWRGDGISPLLPEEIDQEDGKVDEIDYETWELRGETDTDELKPTLKS